MPRHAIRAGRRAGLDQRRAAGPAATEPLERRLLLSVGSTVVTNTNDSGAGSLRQAILNANADAALDSIGFNIPGSGVHSIIPTTALPAITSPCNVVGTGQPGFVEKPVIEIDGASAGSGFLGRGVDG